MPSRILLTTITAFVLGSAISSYAGNPAFIAGSGYNSGVEGNPLIWANGSVQYFTDQGNLSPILTGAQADALVTTAFGTWTSVSTAALTAVQAGHLAEDVNGGNIQTNGYGIVTAPADITSSATSTPIGIVYDYDGTVTDAILGEGAGSIDECFFNAVYGAPDNFSASGNIVHALVVINGVCASTTAQLPDVQYRLVRVLGRILGVGWSQANLNVLTGKPAPTSADYAGFPVMHFADPDNCVPISRCYPNAATLKMDDLDSLTRLYPNSGNLQPSGRVYGSVYFTDASGNALQPMQGVNVVARLMVYDQPSRQYVATSVSGFAYCGNAGNIIDGYVDANGLLYNRWGSSDPSLEGFFDLGELMIPSGQTIAQYQLAVEPVDPFWSLGLESYDPTQVTPSGSFAPVVVTVTNGSNAERDILMLETEIAQVHSGSGSTYASPSALPQGGAWGSWISGYGSADFFEFAAQANRTASVAVTALDESGEPTETKLLPVIGIWELSDESGDPAPAATPSAFNSGTFAMTRLDAQFRVSEMYRVAVADFRGDGRPDYFYQASLLYSDTVAPARVSLAGGVATLNGIGFNTNLQVSANGNNGSTLSVAGGQMQVVLPPAAQDGIATLQIADPASNAFSQMIGALTYGAAATDLLLLLQGTEPPTPIGSQAANILRVRAVAADGVTPVSGATVAWNATNGTQLAVCNGTVSCSVLSDEAGESSSAVTPIVTGASAITIALAPDVYSPPQSQQATIVGTSTTLDLAAVMPTRWIAQGATLAVPLTVEVLDLGAPEPNTTINFILIQGAATLSAASAITNASGVATITAQLTNQNATVQINACVAPPNSQCQTFTMYSIPASQWTLETVRGASQFVVTGQSFQPLIMRITDGSPTANPVAGAPVQFATTLAQISAASGGQQNQEADSGENGMPVLLGSSQTQAVSAQDGTASLVPSTANVGPCALFIAVSAGTSTTQFQMESLVAIIPQTQKRVGAQRATTSSYQPTDAAVAEPQSAPEMLLAIPEGIPSPAIDTPSASVADTSLAGCSEPSSGPVQNESSDSPICLGSKPEEANAPQEPAQPEVHVVPAKAGESVQPKTSLDSSASLPEDKRSCRTLAGDGPLF